MSESQLEFFFSAGTQYYVSGRFAVFAGLPTVSGNLLHRAVEMFLRGGLSTKKSLVRLKALSHNLPLVTSQPVAAAAQRGR